MRGQGRLSSLKWPMAVLLVLSGGIASACSVPVFRYALERWSSDTYLAIVFYDGELTDEQQALVDSLGSGSDAERRTANLEVHAFNVSQLDAEKDAELIELWKAEESQELPRMAVYYPRNSLARGRIWSGPPTKAAVERLIDSPARREAARRILKGETAVWLFVEGEDAQRNDEKFEILEKNIRKAERTLKLPEVDEQDVADGLVTIDPQELKIKFSSLRLSRDDPAEEIFVQMLLRSEKDLLSEEFAGQPLAFPLFGRCRSLYALVGDGIAESTVLEACSFLIGPCTCEVKAQNEHGVDLLTAVDWDSLIEPAVELDKELPPLTGLGAFAVVGDTKRMQDETSPIADESAASHSEPITAEETVGEHGSTSASESSGNPDHVEYQEVTIVNVPILILLGLAVTAIVVGSVFVLRRKST